MDIEANFPKCIAIKTFYSQNDLRLSAYFLPKNVRMPIHDHPKMFVLGYVLLGEMQAEMYTKLAKETYRKETKILKKDDFMLIEGEKDNLHQFTGLSNTVFLDILFPDYDHTNRVCTHYREVSVDATKMTAKLEIDEDP